MTHKYNRFALGLFGALCAPGLAALEYDYTLYSSAEYSDNVRQGSIDEDDPGGILTGGIDFGVNNSPGAVVAVDAVGDFSRRYYSEGGLEAEDRKFLDAGLLVQPRSNNFRLAVLESIQQIQEDRRAVRTVNNLRDVNVFSIVPSYHIDLTTRSRVRASYSYSNIDDEIDLASREVNATTVGYEYSVSDLSDWSLNARRSDIDFTDSGQQVDQESAFFRWAYSGDLTTWMLDVGQERVVEAGDTDHALINFSLRRQLNSFSGLGVFYHHGYSDVVDSSVSGRLTRLVPNSDAVFADELAREKQLTLTYDFGRGNLEGIMRLDGRRLSSEEAVSIGMDVDEDRYSANLSLDYRFPSQYYDLSAFGIGATYRYVDERFNIENEQNEINEAAVRLNYFATRSTHFFFEVRSRNTSGTGPMSHTDEASALVGVRFSPRGG
ncbi:hypothetical protein ACXYTJ_01970 [Gilvimarinus sp. F26214L]|uniref:hypothetical protein n=1 Tax=Gilvimarinus sp. DZF01 TaxID=3461371 RepID=UPI0040457F13